MQQMTQRLFPVFFLLISILTSCMDVSTQSVRTKPNAIGKINQVVVIADKGIWEGEVGDTLRYYLESPYLLLPQPEPIFDLKPFTVQDLKAEPVRKELRTMLILADLSQKESSPAARLIAEHMGEENLRRAREDKSFISTLGKDKWAKDQLLIYVFGFGRQELIKNFKQQFPAIQKQIHKFDANQIEANVYQAGSNLELSSSILDTFDLAIRLPKSFVSAIQNENFIWLREDTRKFVNNIMIHRIPYIKQEQFSEDGIKAIRDSLGKKYITTDVEGAFMQINDRDLPIITRATTLNGNYAFEARGIWEMNKAFMGGPFVSYLIHNQEKEQLLFVDGFVYGPGEEKREPMQELEHILSTIEY
jgi:hypothetical protein